ncbi:MAG TPA: NDP-sugar synthase, partial [Actinomycetota bacterium]|nr:NDP-sugar synthase [Actinomycetota bacterium]
GFIEKPPPGSAPTNLINAGVYLFEPSILDRIPAGVEYSAEHGLFPGLVSEGAALFATPTDAYWMDIGTPQKYLTANLDALSGRFVTDAVPDPGPRAVVVGDGAEVAEDARVSSSCVGAGTTVAPRAIVERSVLLPGVRIGAGARVIGSVLGEGAVVDDGAVLEDETIGDRERVST